MLDSLRVPSDDQLKGDMPQPDELPFFCLLEDDSLVTGMKVVMRQWLTPPDEKSTEKEVRIQMTAVIKPTEITPGNLLFLSGMLDG